MEYLSDIAMRIAVTMEAHAALSTTTAAKAEAICDILASITPPAPERPKEEVDIEATAENIARKLSAIDGGRFHEPTYNAAKAGAIEGLKCALSALETPPLHKEGEAAYFAEGNTVRKRVGSAFGEGDVLFCTPSAWFPANEVADLLNAAPVPVPVTITDEWRSRNTMPKDGSPFLVSYASHVFRARWWGGTTLSVDGRASGIAAVDASGWMPLPPAALSVKPGEQG